MSQLINDCGENGEIIFNKVPHNVETKEKAHKYARAHNPKNFDRLLPSDNNMDRSLLGKDETVGEKNLAKENKPHGTSLII